MAERKSGEYMQISGWLLLQIANLRLLAVFLEESTQIVVHA